VSPQAPSAAQSDPEQHAGLPGLLAAAVIGLQALGCAGFAVLVLFVAPNRASLSPISHLMFSVFTMLLAVVLGLVTRGLWRALSWARTACVVWSVMLLPLAWGVVQAGRVLVGGLILGGAVVGIGAVVMESSRPARPSTDADHERDADPERHVLEDLPDDHADGMS